MGAFIARQPNGLYCRFSRTVDCPTHVNMTREDYLNDVTQTLDNREEGEVILGYYLKPFEEVLNCYTDLNMSHEEFEALLQVMKEPPGERGWFAT